MKGEAASLDERFDVTTLSRTSTNLQKSEPYEPEDAAHALEEAMYSWGFDPVIVNTWLGNTAASWEALKHE